MITKKNIRPGKYTLTKYLLALGFALTSSAAVTGDLPKKKVTKGNLYLTAAQAKEMLAEKDVVLIDIRSRAEITFLGIPTRANVNIPYMILPLLPEYDAKKATYKLEINPDFSTDFEAYVKANGLSDNARFVLMCRSGSRSAKAANLLYSMGYGKVYSLVDGYEGDKAKEGPNRGKRVLNGWKNAGLSWSYKIQPNQAYPADVIH